MAGRAELRTCGAGRSDLKRLLWKTVGGVLHGELSPELRWERRGGLVRGGGGGGNGGTLEICDLGVWQVDDGGGWGRCEKW